MPKGDVPGEWYAPTQPFSTKPPAYDRQGVSIDDLIDFTPELRAEAVEQVAEVQDRSDLHAAGRQQARRSARRRWCCRRRPAARTGRAARTIRKRTSLYVYSQTNVEPARPRAAARREGVGHELRPGLARRPACATRGGSGAGAGGGRSGAGAGGACAAAAAEGGGAGVTVQGLPLHQAAVRPDQRDRSRQGRDPVADRARRDAGQRQEQPGAERA